MRGGTFLYYVLEGFGGQIGMNVLLVGGAGYIGSHTAVELLSAVYNVVIADNYSNSSPTVINRIHQITGRKVASYSIDASVKEQLLPVFQRENIDAVMLIAGYKAVAESVSNPLKYYWNNIGITLAVLSAMEQFGVYYLVFSSSATVYGIPSRLPISEDMPTSATNPYGQTKLMTEQILKDICQASSQWSVGLLRYFNPVGAHKSGLIGEEPNGIPNNLIPYIAKVAAGELEKVHVFGNDYPTKDGTGVRDYIHVVDLAKGHIAALNYIMEHKGCFTCNLGTGNPYSVLDMICEFEKAAQRRIPYVFEPRRPGDVASCYADPGRAWEELGWKAELSLRDMCEDTWRWQCNHHRLN